KDHPVNSTLDMVVTETNTDNGLKLATIARMLGTDAPPAGSQPVLVHLKGAGAPSLPKNNDYSLTGGAAGVAATKDIDKDTGGGVAFTVEAKREGADGNNTKVTIKDVDATAD